MENVTQAVQDELVKSLDYKLGSSNVNYIQSRRDVQYYPSSLSTFTPTTSRVARIPLTSGMDFIDPESLKIAFRVRNNDATLDLNPGTQEPSCFIKQVQLFANGQRCDDISEYGRCCFLYSLLKPAEWYKNKGITGFWELAGLVPAPVPAQNYKDVLMAPTLIGMFQAGKFLPPQLNLVLELEFAEPADALRPGGGSTDYSIENVRVLASQVTLDSALYESYQKILLSGRGPSSWAPSCPSGTSTTPTWGSAATSSTRAMGASSRRAPWSPRCNWGRFNTPGHLWSATRNIFTFSKSWPERTILRSKTCASPTTSGTTASSLPLFRWNMCPSTPSAASPPAPGTSRGSASRAWWRIGCSACTSISSAIKL